MDHLPLPSDSEPPPIEVPVLCTDSERMYDNLNYMTFPERCGFKTAGGNKDFRYLVIRELASHDWRTTLEMLQEWLYFGLLRAVFDDAFQRSDLIKDKPEGRQVVDSHKLLSLISEKQRQLSAQHTLNIQRFGNVVTGYLDHAERQHENLEIGLRDERSLIFPFPELMISLRILEQTLRLVCGRDAGPETSYLTKTTPHFLYPSFLPICRHLTPARGWCPKQALHLCNTLSHTSLYYLASLRRRNNADHSACAEDSSPVCIAQNIPAGFKGRHADASCHCQPKPAINPGALSVILRDGGIPVVSAKWTATNEVELEYVRALPGMNYTAISHLWSDGLGDPLHNYLPTCQLLKLLDRVRDLQNNLALRSVFSRSRISKKPLFFWLDVYCVPLGIVDADTDVLQRTAISRMVPTYALARTMLVLDRELQVVTSSVYIAELVAHIMLSGWRGRYWTHQELTLASNPLCQLSDGAVAWIERASAVAMKAPKTTRLRMPWPWTYIYPRLPEGLNDLWILAMNVAGTTRLPWPWRYPRSPDILNYILFELYDSASSTRPGREQHRLHTDYKVRQDCCLTNACEKANQMDMPRTSLDESVFCKVWNGFVGKTSSRPEDIHSILANSLDLKASDLLPLTTAADRMKAIIKSLAWLPVGMVLDSPPAYVQEAGLKPLVEDAPWIPRFPGERGRLFETHVRLQTTLGMQVHKERNREPTCPMLRVTCKGLRLHRDLLSNKDAPFSLVSLKRIPGALDLGRKEMLIQVPDAGDVHPGASLRLVPVYVKAMADSGVDLVRWIIAGDRAFCILMEHNNDPGGSQWRRGDVSHWRRGAVVEQLREDDGTLYTQYICPVRWTSEECNIPVCLADRVNGPIDVGREQCSLLRDKDILLSCDMAGWPILRPQRVPGLTRVDGRGRWVTRLSLTHSSAAALWFIFFWASLIAVIVVSATSGNIEDVIITYFSSGGALACLTVTKIVATLGISTWRSARYYIALETFLEDSAPDQPWWEKLERALPLHASDTSTEWNIRESMALLTLRHIITVRRRIARAQHALGRYRRSRKLRRAEGNAEHELDELSAGENAPQGV